MSKLVGAVAPVIGSLFGGSIGSVVGGFVGDRLLRKKPQLVNVQQAGATMPTPDDDAVEAARRRRAVQMMQRGGRASTILSSEDRLGG